MAAGWPAVVMNYIQSGLFAGLITERVNPARVEARLVQAALLPRFLAITVPTCGFRNAQKE
jgi:hypothetical protein